jgi:CopG family nickel-responsive transcriptional regulator
MSGLVRFGVSIEENLLAEFDRAIEKQGYANRSEAIRDLIRDRLVDLQWEAGSEEAVATVTLVFDHGMRELAEKLDHLQHHEFEVIVSSTHVHLDEQSCLEVLILRGPAERLRRIAEKLISVRGVRHGKLVMTATGELFKTK